jgi:uridylate kinase
MNDPGVKAEPKPGQSPVRRVPLNRVLLKISGEGLCRPGGQGLDLEQVTRLAEQIVDVRRLGVQLGVVVGGGNLIRGGQLSQLGVDRATADYMGMLGTLINAIALQEACERAGAETRVLSALHVREVAEPWIRRRALRHMEKGRIILLACGTGSPLVTTDTAAALRARELNADVILKGTKVEGVFTKDPVGHPDATVFKSLSYMDVLNRDIRVMDKTAIAMCMEHNLKIIVFNLMNPGNLIRVVRGEEVGTVISKEGS